MLAMARCGWRVAGGGGTGQGRIIGDEGAEYTALADETNK